MRVALYSYNEDREQLKNWAAKQGDDGIKTYWRNQKRIGSLETNILERNT